MSSYEVKHYSSKIVPHVYVYVLATNDHADIPHVLFDYHAEGGAKKPEKLEAKV